MSSGSTANQPSINRMGLFTDSDSTSRYGSFGPQRRHIVNAAHDKQKPCRVKKRPVESTSHHKADDTKCDPFRQRDWNLDLSTWNRAESLDRMASVSRSIKHFVK